MPFAVQLSDQRLDRRIGLFHLALCNHAHRLSIRRIAQTIRVAEREHPFPILVRREVMPPRAVLSKVTGGEKGDDLLQIVVAADTENEMHLIAYVGLERRQHCRTERVTRRRDARAALPRQIRSGSEIGVPICYLASVARADL